MKYDLIYETPEGHPPTIFTDVDPHIYERKAEEFRRVFENVGLHCHGETHWSFWTLVAGEFYYLHVKKRSE